MKTAIDFLKSIDNPQMTAVHRIHAILWWISREDSTIGLNTKALCEIIESIGHPKQNASRLKVQLLADKTICKVPNKDEWRLHFSTRRTYDDKFGSFILTPKSPSASDSILPKSLFNDTRSYIERVVYQINSSYDLTLYDCCAVMCRRLLETLIIEVYEGAGISHEIKNSEGHFFMFADLLRIFEKNTTFNLGRNTKQGLAEFKKLGDLSAHNRRFNARKEDIDRIRDGIRIASEELLHLAKFK